MGAALSIPQQLGAAIWLRADLGITLATGVSNWVDQAGLATVSQATGANQLVYNATDAAYNNQATIQCDSLTKFLASSAFTAIPQPFSVFTIGQISTANGVQWGSQSGTSPQLFDAAGSTAIFATTQVTDAVSPTTPRAFMGIFNGASSVAGADDWVSGGTTGTTTGSLSQLGILAIAAGTGGSLGKIAELIVIPRAATAGDKASLAAYFLARYGKTVT